MIDISDDEINIIKHAWTKSSSESLFDVAMGSYDGAEICEMVGLYILNKGLVIIYQGGWGGVIQNFKE